MRCKVIILALFALSGCTTMQLQEGSFIRPDKPGQADGAARLDVAALLPAAHVTDAALTTDDGAVLRGVIAMQAGAKVTLLYFGGNVFHLDRHGERMLPLLAACGANVAVFDYRGYGRSSGAPTVANMAADAVRVFDYVSAQGTPVIVHGQSLGSFMAAQVVRQRPQAAGLVLEATATTVQDWANANLPWCAWPFVRLEIADSLRAVDNLAAVAGYQGASLVLAGARDRITPAALGQRVYAALPPARKRWLLAGGAGHDDIFGQAEVMPAYCALVARGAP